MNIKHRAKKGFSLVEILISITILVILIIPLSSMIMTSMKKNKQSEKVQEASSKGQSLIEEFSAYDQINFTDEANPSGILEKRITTLDGTNFYFDCINLGEKYKSDITTWGKYKVVMNLNRESKDLYNAKNNEDDAKDSNYYATIEFKKSNMIAISYESHNGERKTTNLNYKGKRLDIWLDVSSAANAITSMIISDFQGNDDINNGKEFDDTSEDKFVSENKIQTPSNDEAKRKIKILVDKDFSREAPAPQEDLPVKLHCYGTLNSSNVTADIYIEKDDNNSNQMTILPSCLYETFPDSLADKLYLTKGKNYNTEIKVKQNKSNENVDVPSDIYTMSISVYDKRDSDNDITNGSAKPLFKGKLTDNISIPNN